MTWAIGRDPTHLSSLQQCLQATHEKLLQMDSSQCPPYVALNDLQAYKGVFGPQGFCCRFRSCPASESGLPSIVLRTNHETEHFPTHSCKECDFSVRGFKSKGALNRHTMKYHPKLQQMELPQQLFPAARPNLVGARSLPSSRKRVAKRPSPMTPQHDALIDECQPESVSSQLLQSAEESTPGLSHIKANTMLHITMSLQSQGPFSGWQATITVEQRVMQVELLINSLLLIKPVIELVRAVQVSLSFEQKAFVQSSSLDAYVGMCKQKLGQIRDTRQQQQNSANAQNAPNQNNSIQQMQQAQQQQHNSMIMAQTVNQTTPVQQGGMQENTGFMQGQQQKPLPPWKPSKEDNEAINKLAAQMAERTPQADIAKTRANLDNITMQQREIMNQKGLDPLVYFFRTQAAKEYRRQKMNEMAASSSADSKYPKVTKGMNDNINKAFGAAVELQPGSQPTQVPGKQMPGFQQELIDKVNPALMQYHKTPDQSYANREYLFQDNDVYNTQSNLPDPYQTFPQVVNGWQSNVDLADLSSTHGLSPTNLQSLDKHMPALVSGEWPPRSASPAPRYHPQSS
jgi:hypothetical protein